MKIIIVSVRVTDQDRALKFYTETLGFEVTEDMDLGALFFAVDDCRARFDELVAKGVEVIQEPMERFYGIDAAFRDDSGNHIRMTQQVETGIKPPV